MAGDRRGDDSSQAQGACHAARAHPRKPQVGQGQEGRAGTTQGLSADSTGQTGEARQAGLRTSEIG